MAIKLKDGISGWKWKLFMIMILFYTCRYKFLPKELTKRVKAEIQRSEQSTKAYFCPSFCQSWWTQAYVITVYLSRGIENELCCCLAFYDWSCLTLSNPMDCSTVRFPCPSLFPRVCSNSCPLSLWYQPIISSSITPFSSFPHSFPVWWGNSGNSVRLYFSGLQNHCRWWLQPWN